MGKLLIACDLFPPAFGPRMGYLTKYLKALGWEVVVVTERSSDHIFDVLTGYADRVVYVNYGQSWITWLCAMIADFLFNYKNRKIKKAMKRLLAEESFDVVLCSTYRLFPLEAASQVARKAGLPFVADLRDVIEQYTGNEFLKHKLPDWIASRYRTRSIRKRNRVLKQADWVTTISSWHVELLKQYNPNVSLIYNGFDPELFYSQVIPTPVFTIAYTGRVLSLAMRDPSLLFEAVARLARENYILPDYFRIGWYVDEASQRLLLPLIKKYDLASYTDFHGIVAAAKIPNILNRSSVLLLLTNKADAQGPKGVMTTKIFEAFAVEKPVLCVRSDEGVLADTISRAHAGVSARTADEAYTFIRGQYDVWRRKRSTHAAVDRTFVQSFSRRSQAEQFIHIFDKLAKHQTNG